MCAFFCKKVRASQRTVPPACPAQHITYTQTNTHLREARDLIRDLQRHLHRLVRGHHARDQAVPLRLRRIDHAPRQHHLHRLGLSNGADEPLRAAAPCGVDTWKGWAGQVMRAIIMDVSSALDVCPQSFIHPFQHRMACMYACRHLPGMTPRVISGCPNLAVSPAMITSVIIISSHPPPSA